MAACLSVVGIAPAWSFGWPSLESVIKKNFGQWKDRSLLPGVEIETAEREIRSPNAGEVVFLFNPQEQKSQNLPSSLGGFIVLNHEANLRTAVTNIQFPAKLNKEKYQKGEIIGSLAFREGEATGRLKVFVFDQLVGELVNPLLILPPPSDTKPPVVVDVTLEGEAGTASRFSLFARSSVAVGFWRIFLETADLEGPRGKEFPRGIHSIQVYLNGSDVFHLSFDSLQEKSGQWFVKGMDKPLGEFLLGDRKWQLGQVFFNQGTNILEIVVKDFAGNETNRTFRVIGSRL